MRVNEEGQGQAEIAPRAKQWLLGQLEALAQQQAGPIALDDDEYRIVRAERFFALRVLISAVRAQM